MTTTTTRRRGGEEEMEEEEEEGEEASIFSFALKVWIKSVSFLLMIKKMLLTIEQRAGSGACLLSL